MIKLGGLQPNTTYKIAFSTTNNQLPSVQIKSNNEGVLNYQTNLKGAPLSYLVNITKEANADEK